MTITLEQAKNLRPGTVLLYTDGSRWCVNGKVKTWKRDPSRVQVPLKHGLYNYGYLTENNLDSFTFEES